jgi:pyruvate/2-oxoglutarate dehydrogenase complex dihydrolipoamide dehydrogenase (E3) component
MNATSVPGLFAAGDVRRGATRRVAAAVGDGALAIEQIHERLAAIGAGRTPRRPAMKTGSYSVRIDQNETLSAIA